MEFVIPMLIVIVIGAVMIPVALRRNRTTSQTGVTRRGGMPRPGEPAAHRDGEPVPGSRDDRSRRGQP